MGLIDTFDSERLKHPYEPGEWIEIRPLTGPERDEAQEAKYRQYLALSADRQGMSDGRSQGASSDIDLDRLSFRVQMYDPTVLLGYAITAWSYDAPVTPENTARLDALTRDWLMEEVVSRNTRPSGGDRADAPPSGDRQAAAGAGLSGLPQEGGRADNTVGLPDSRSPEPR